MLKQFLYYSRQKIRWSDKVQTEYVDQTKIRWSDKFPDNDVIMGLALLSNAILYYVGRPPLPWPCYKPCYKPNPSSSPNPKKAASYCTKLTPNPRYGLAISLAINLALTLALALALALALSLVHSADPVSVLDSVDPASGGWPHLHKKCTQRPRYWPPRKGALYYF
jgi:hypothetical protein